MYKKNEHLTYIRTFDELLKYIHNNSFNGVQNGIRDANNEKGIWIKKTSDGMESVIISNNDVEKNDKRRSRC